MKEKLSKSQKKALPPIIDDTEYHFANWPLPVGTARFFILPFRDDDGVVQWSVVDGAVWPFGDVICKNFVTSPLYEQSRALHYHNNTTFFKAESDTDDVQIFTISDFETPNIQMWGNSYTHKYALGHIMIFGRYLFYTTNPFYQKNRDPTRDAQNDHKRPKADDLWLMCDGQTKQLARLDPVPSYYVAMCETKLLLFYLHDRGVKEYRIFDITTETLGSVTTLPFVAHFFAERLNEDEFIFSQAQEGEHPTHRGLPAATGFLCRYNLITGKCAHARLNGLYNKYTANFGMGPQGKPVKHKIESFDGGLDVSQGHEGWMVLNYATHSPGPNAVAWIWNTDTDEVVEIKRSDFSNAHPDIVYNPYLKRYMAVQPERIDLLIPFDVIYATRPRGKLEWVDGLVS